MRKKKMELVMVLLSATLLLVLATVSGQADSEQPPAEQRAAAEKPEVMVQEPFREWVVGGSFIYWAERCSAAPDAVASTVPTAPTAADAQYSLRRLPAGRGITRTLVTVGDADCETFLNMTADESGVYFFNKSRGRIEAFPVDSRTGAEASIVGSNVSGVKAGLTLDDVYVYFANDKDQIIRTAKNGRGGGVIVSGVGSVEDIAVDKSHLYWINEDGLWWAPKSCASPPCTKTKLSDNSGNRLLLGSEGLGGQPRIVFLVQIGTKWRILRMACSIISGSPVVCGAKEIYTGTSFAQMGAPTRVIRGSIFRPQEWLYWIEKSGADSRLKRLLISGDGNDAEDLYQGSPIFVNVQTFADSGYVYFAEVKTGQERIMRLPLAADPLLRDFAFAQWEVTQGVQSLLQDVKLVAGKTTFVRVFGQQLNGQRSNNVEAVLRGYRGAQELPGSPLNPVKNVVQSVAPGQTYDRTDENSGWLFRLPQSWTAAGLITLRAEIDPGDSYSDTDRGNNDNQGPITFEPSRSPCAVFIPVLTDQPLPSAFNNPNFMPVVDLLENMWPVAGILPYQQSEPITEGGGPFEMEDDAGKVLMEVRRRWSMGDHPAACPGNTQHFFVGMVHPSASSGGVGGAAHRTGTASWVKIPEDYLNFDEQNVNYPARFFGGYAYSGQISYGTILAHEMSHNAGRKHLDCPKDGPANTDSDWPYLGFECQLDKYGANSPNSHFGFSARLLKPIPGEEAADFMTYDLGTTWVSDYTSNALLDRLCEDPGDCPAIAVQETVGAKREKSSQDTILVSGVVNGQSAEGDMDKAWVFPAGSVSAAVGERWQKMAYRQPANQAAQHESANEPQITIKLRDKDGSLLVEQDVIPETAESGPNEEDEKYFVTAIIAPNIIIGPNNLLGQIELWINGQLAQTIKPGGNAPQVTINQPNGSETVDGSLTLSFSVSDADADSPETIIQYSPDQGASWFMLAGPLPAAPGTMAMDFDLRGLPGSHGRQAQLRVLATDGLHTTIETTPVFSVADNAPQVFISSPLAGQQFAAGESIYFSGEALDPEDGPLPGEVLSWLLDGEPAGSGSELRVAGLAPGAYEVTLSVQDSGGNKGQVKAQFTVAALVIPTGGAPALDGYCDDTAYVDGARVPLAPSDNANGSGGSVRSIRSGDSLWVCFSGLQRSKSLSPHRASVRLDPDYSRHGNAQTDDYVFFVDEDGSPQVLSGDNQGGLQEIGMQGLATKVSASNGAWQAELRIPVDFFQGWDRVVGLALANISSTGNGAQWPSEADSFMKISPKSWGTAVLGQRPQILEVGPDTAQAGGPGFALTVKGTGFVNDSQVLWDGEPLTTLYIGENDLEAQVPAANLRGGGTIALRVANPNMLEAPSDKLPFPVENPQPVLDSISPETAKAGAGSLSLVVKGKGFVPGSQLVFGGQVLSIQVVSGSELRAQIAKADLGLPGQVPVVVYNRAPGGGSSAAQLFDVAPNDGSNPDQALYLPIVRRP